ncbi:hypothetical protein KR100_00995 [Synechococcus sp. KORDI-100]|nr:hypothetical protein KR100_00995 [Synechococcus sp. KORDI-100]
MYQLLLAAMSSVLCRVHPIIVAGALLVSALFMAPEEPAQQASICQRLHSVDACRVW